MATNTPDLLEGAIAVELAGSDLVRLGAALTAASVHFDETGRKGHAHVKLARQALSRLMGRILTAQTALDLFDPPVVNLIPRARIDAPEPPKPAA